MTLPSVSGLGASTSNDWVATRARLDAIMGDPLIAKATADVAHLPSHLGQAIARWRLRKNATAGAFAARLFAHADTTTEDEAREAFGAEVFARLSGVGVLAHVDNRIASSFQLRHIGGVYIWFDHLAGPDSVMGPGATTLQLIDAANPASHVDSLLDLGCGAGTLALVLARSARHVVATDVNERAIALARFNALFNAIENVELRVGNLYDPTPDRFDRVVSQPPFVSHPAEVDPRVFMDGGVRGDELPLAVLQGLSAHLAEDGHGIILADFPVFKDDAVLPRIARVVEQDDLDVLVVSSTRLAPERHAARYAVVDAPALDAEFEESLIRRCDHLDRLGVESIEQAIVCVRRAKGRRRWVDRLDVLAPDDGELGVTERWLDKRFAARDLIALGTERLHAARLRIAAGANFGPPSKEGIAIRFADPLLADRMVSNDLARFAQAIQRASTAGDAVRTFARTAGLTRAKANEALGGAVEDLLKTGVLEIAS